MINTIDNLNNLSSEELERLDKIIDTNNSSLLFIDLIRAVDTYFIAVRVIHQRLPHHCYDL
jgi:hypothetical protein